MTTHPVFPFLYERFLADTMHLSPAQKWSYLALLLHSWATGMLPFMHDKAMAQICDVDVRTYAAWKPTLKAFFDDQWRQKRLEIERARSLDIRSKRSTSAQASVAARAQQKAIKKPTNGPANVSANVQHPYPPSSLRSEGKGKKGGRATSNVSARATSAAATLPMDEAAVESRRVALLATARDAPPNVVVDEGLQPIGGALDAKLEALGKLIKSKPTPKEPPQKERRK